MLKFFKSTDKKKKQKAAKVNMGCSSSQPAVKDSKPAPTTAKAAPATPAEPQHPDNGLKSTHELIKFLGRGGTGDTYLFKDRVSGEDVAIKLMKRPLPKVIMPNILREIRVGSLPCLMLSKGAAVESSRQALELQTAASARSWQAGCRPTRSDQALKCHESRSALAAAHKTELVLARGFWVDFRPSTGQAVSEHTYPRKHRLLLQMLYGVLKQPRCVCWNCRYSRS